MANQTEYDMFITFLMSNDNPKSRTPKRATFTQRVTTVAGQAYVAAADDAARAATTVGDLITKTAALSIGVVEEFGVKFRSIVNPSPAPPAPSTFTYAFEKLVAHYKAGANNRHVSIPARKESALTMESDGLDVLLADGAAVADWVTAFQLIALDEDTNFGTVQRITVSG